VKIKSHLIEFDPQGSYATLRVSLEDFDEDALEELTQIQNHVGDRPPLLVIDIKMMARANRATNAYRRSWFKHLTLILADNKRKEGLPEKVTAEELLSFHYQMGYQLFPAEDLHVGNQVIPTRPSIRNLSDDDIRNCIDKLKDIYVDVDFQW